MNPKCSGDQQLEAGGQRPHTGGSTLFTGGDGEGHMRPGVLICNGNVGVYAILGRRFSFDCTGPRSPQIRPILLGYLGFTG